MCEFFADITEDSPRLAPLQDGACPECGEKLILHRHTIPMLVMWMLDKANPFWSFEVNAKEHVQLVTPSENLFSKCPNGHGCWRREGPRVWALWAPCCGMLTMRMEAYAQAKLMGMPDSLIRRKLGL